jgi:hypothetical protein
MNTPAQSNTEQPLAPEGPIQPLVAVCDALGKYALGKYWSIPAAVATTALDRVIQPSEIPPAASA